MTEKSSPERQAEKRLRRKIERCVREVGFSKREARALAATIADEGMRIKRRLGNPDLGLMAVEQPNGAIRFALTYDAPADPTLRDVSETMCAEALERVGAGQ